MLVLMAAMKQSRLTPQRWIFGTNQGNQVMLVVDGCSGLGKLTDLPKFNQNCPIDCNCIGNREDVDSL